MNQEYEKPEELKFREFVDEVKKYDKINNELLEMLIRRYTPGSRRFFNQKHKTSYFKFWVKRLHQAGIIKPTPIGFGMWDVQNG